MTEPTVEGVIAIMPLTSSALDTGETLALKQQLLPLPGLFFGSALRGDADNDTAAHHTNLRSVCGAICHQVSDAQLPQLGFLAGMARVKDSAVVKSAAEKEACHAEKELPFEVWPTLVVDAFRDIYSISVYTSSVFDHYRKPMAHQGLLLSRLFFHYRWTVQA